MSTDGPGTVEDAVRRPPSSLGPPAGPWRGRSLIATAIVAVVTVLLGLFLGFGLGRDPGVVPSALERRPAPPFALRTLDGSEVVRLADLRGHVVVVNFWASWCGPCRGEAPVLQAAWERYRDRGVVVIGISFEDTPAAGLKFARQYGKTYPLLADPGSRTAIDYGVFGIPETFLIGPDGRVAFKHTGPVTYEMLTGWISRLLRGAPA